jgi:hypothetical protein
VRPGRPSLGGLLKSRKITRDQSVLFRARPPFDLTLRSDGVCDAIKMFREYKDDWAARRCVSIECSGLMFGDAFL